jgi:hypothetical protein
MKTTTYTQEQSIEMVNKLEVNQRAITSLRKVAGGTKIQFELAEKMERTGDGAINLLALMNKGDERFEQGGARRAWMTAEAAQVTAFFGIDADDLAEVGEEPTFIWILNPEVQGLDLRLQIKETTVGTEYEMANVDTRAKRAGKNGPILSVEGEPIFSHTNIIACAKGENPVHIILVSDQQRARNGEVVKLAPVAAPSLD